MYSCTVRFLQKVHDVGLSGILDGGERLGTEANAWLLASCAISPQRRAIESLRISMSVDRWNLRISRRARDTARLGLFLPTAGRAVVLIALFWRLYPRTHRPSDRVAPEASFAPLLRAVLVAWRAML